MLVHKNIIRKYVSHSVQEMSYTFRKYTLNTLWKVSRKSINELA